MRGNCPRCAGLMVTSDDEILCVQCGYVDYVSPPPQVPRSRRERERVGPTRVCAWYRCAQTFRAYKGDHRFCSVECRRAEEHRRYTASLSRRTCQYCNEQYTPSRRGQIYCSRACNARAGNERHAKGPKAGQCILCGAEFLSERGTMRYCSSSCKYKSYRMRKKALKTAHSL